MKVGFMALVASVALCAFSIVGCNLGSEADDGHGGDGGSGASAGTGGSGGSGGTGASGGTGGSGAIGGTGGSGASGGTGGSGAIGGTGGSGASGGTGGLGGTGGSSSCAELDIPGEPNLSGTLSISPTVASRDEFMTVSVGVDADTREVTALLFNTSTSTLAGSGFASTSGDATVDVDVLVGTTAEPGPHAVELELRGESASAIDYILYTPGDDNTYVRIKVESGIFGAETATTCLEVNATIE